MAAQEKVSAQQIVNALLKWTGNVQAAADELGVSRNALYKRVEQLGIDLRGIRAMGSKVDTTFTTVLGMPTMKGGANVVSKSSAAIFSARARGPKLPSMRTEAAEAATEIPIRTAAKRLPPTRIKPAHRELFQRAAWALQARFQAPTDESLILEQFIDERFEEWLGSKLASAKAKAKDQK